MNNGQEDKKQHLHEIVKSFDEAMLVTLRQDGRPRGRPMAVAGVDPDETVYFATLIDSPKLDELDKHPQVAVTMQGKMKYASLSGHATIDRDRAKIDRFWRETWKAWFPNGKDDPKLCLIRVSPEEGEYWDNSGKEGVKYVLEVARALVTGDRAKPEDTKINGRVDL